MLIENNSEYLLKRTRAAAKEIEYEIDKGLRAKPQEKIPELLLIAIGCIGDVSSEILRDSQWNLDVINRYKSELVFSSRFFDSYLNAELDKNLNHYYLLLGSIAYYLCDYIGNSKVLIKNIIPSRFNLESNNLEHLLLYLLSDGKKVYMELKPENPYCDYIKRFMDMSREFFDNGINIDKTIIKEFREVVHEIGTSREILLIDALLAIFLLKYNHSAFMCLPQFTGIDIGVLRPLISKGNFIKEFWPAQRRLGEEGIYSGSSAVIQMPTGSGKTKAISLAIYAAFLTERTSLAVIVAPFRALCREISRDLKNDFKFDKEIYVDEISDVLQTDKIFSDLNALKGKNVLIFTPEKLLYILRQKVDLVGHIGLIIFDEGHLFDDQSRGATYELLLSTIIGYINSSTQKILISAVVPNAVDINNWLNKGEGKVIADNSITTTEKSVSIVNWQRRDSEHFGYLYFVNPKDPEEEEFYVPRLIEITKLHKLPKERNERYFPEVDFKNSFVANNDIAVYCTLKLIHNGGVAIFCGRKDSANKILERFLDIERRGYEISILRNISFGEEVEKISILIKENYGDENIYFRAAQKAVFVHHGGISEGLKNSIEYAMRKGYIKCLVCTSTLAQGVNLPIRYLIISSVYQSKERIKVRDFHNLIGRTGRSGIYTEGTIIFSESFVYKNSKNRWKWDGYKNLLNANNSEDCTSILLNLVKPVPLSKKHIVFSKIIQRYYIDPDSRKNNYEALHKRISNHDPELLKEFEYKYNQIINTLQAIENFLTSYFSMETFDEAKIQIESLLKQTFAYSLANDEEKKKLLEVFLLIGEYIYKQLPDSNNRYLCSKTLLGIESFEHISSWVNANNEKIIGCSTLEELLNYIFPLMLELSENKTINATIDKSQIVELAHLWISGKPYIEILNLSNKLNIQIIYRNRPKAIELEEIINLCDEGFGYSNTVLISAISELVEVEEDANIKILLNELGRRFRYGLPNLQTIMLFELGFNDRVVAIDMSNYLPPFSNNKPELIFQLQQSNEVLQEILKKYPSVFSNLLYRLLY